MSRFCLFFLSFVFFIIIFLFLGLSNTVANVKSFVHKILVPSVVVKLINDSHKYDNSSSPPVMVKLVVRSVERTWPIPEAFWVDKSVDNLPVRCLYSIRY